MTPAIFVINRRADHDRLAQFAASAAAFGLEYERIAALDGHDPLAPLFLYRHLLGDTFWGRDRSNPGPLHVTFHMRLPGDGCWRQIMRWR